MHSHITGYKKIDKYYVIDPSKIDDESEEYDLYLELIGGMIDNCDRRLRDIPTLLTSRQKNRC